MKTCARNGCDNHVRSRHARARYCSNACKSQGWRDREGYVLTAVRKACQTPKRRATRDGNGMRLYVSTAEARELAAGRTPATVAAKASAKLKPADPLPGQQSIYDALTEESHGDAA